MTEAQLQASVGRLLDTLGIVYIRSRFDKRSTVKPGTPDFIFCVPNYNLCAVVGMAWECKLPKNKLRPEQEAMRKKMTTRPNAWKYCVITSLDEAIAELKKIGMLS